MIFVVALALFLATLTWTWDDSLYGFSYGAVIVLTTIVYIAIIDVIGKAIFT